MVGTHDHLHAPVKRIGLINAMLYPPSSSIEEKEVDGLIEDRKMARYLGTLEEMFLRFQRFSSNSTKQNQICTSISLRCGAELRVGCVID